MLSVSDFDTANLQWLPCSYFIFHISGASFKNYFKLICS